MTETTTPTSFTRMDEGTAEHWAVIMDHHFTNQGRVAERVLMLLRSLAEITDGFAVDQLTHSLQTATIAERAGADDELVVAALCHDIGKSISVMNHPRIAAEILRPYVRPEVTWIVAQHGLFQNYYYVHHLGGDRNARERFRDHPWYAATQHFCATWDQCSFDPHYRSEPLDYFEPLVRRIFARTPHDPRYLSRAAS